MKKVAADQAGKRKRERGSVLATSAIGMLAVLMAVGLGIDISRLYLSKAELQNAADHAALAWPGGPYRGCYPSRNHPTRRPRPQAGAAASPEA